MRITKTFYYVRYISSASISLIINDKAEPLYSCNINERCIENALDRVIPDFHNLASIDKVGDDYIAVTYNVRGIKRL